LTRSHRTRILGAYDEFFVNTECNRIAYALASAINGEAWHGDSLRTILDNVTAEQAEGRPLPNIHTAHSIWELVLHLEAWVKFCLGAVQGTPIPTWLAMPKERDWPPVVEAGEQAWKQAVNSFFSSHLELVEALKTLSDDRLEATVPGRRYNFYRLFRGMIQHAIYHGAQVVQLKQMLLFAVEFPEFFHPEAPSESTEFQNCAFLSCAIFC
jgi:hypothetical protein